MPKAHRFALEARDKTESRTDGRTEERIAALLNASYSPSTAGTLL